MLAKPLAVTSAHRYYITYTFWLCVSLWVDCRVDCRATIARSAIVAYCIIHQAKDRQTVRNVNEKYTPSPSAATANTHWPSNCSTSNKGRCMVHTLAGAAGTWFIQTVLTKYETRHKCDRNSSSAQRYDGASTIHDDRLPYNKHSTNIVVVRILSGFHKRQLLFIVAGYAFVSNPVLLLNFVEFGC